MTKAMQEAFRLFLLHWLEVRQLELESRLAGLTERRGERATKLEREFVEIQRVSRRLAEEHYKQGGHNAKG